MGTFVTLAEVLEARGSPLDEDEVWCLLLATTEALLDISKKGSGNICNVLSPGSTLLSANGSLAFKSCARYEDVASYKAPEVQQGHPASSRTAAEKMVVYSLGMTFYWCVDYRLPQNQPVHLSSELEGLLLSMCEDVAARRTDLLSVLEACELHHRTTMLLPVERLIRQLVEEVYRNSADHTPVAENGSELTDRSQMIRHRLHSGSFSNSTWELKKKISRTFSGSCEPTGIPPASQQRDSYSSWQQLNRSPCSPYMDSNQNTTSRSLTQFESTNSLNDKKVKEMCPEFIRMLDEPQVVLELPSSIVSKKGKSPSNQRELSVLMPNGQSILVKCEVKSRGGDVFDMIVAHSNLMEHFYFGLAYIDDNEFFFVDNDTKISKVAPDSWKKVPTTTFVLYFRVKFFVSDISLLLHKQTHHQYYLQLRQDLLEDRLCCHEDTALYLGALALQRECGDCMPEVYGRNYYRPDQYVPKSVMEKRALPYIQGELTRLHANNAQMPADESELEFLKGCQQLPEYGVMFHQVVREKKPQEGEIILGVCAKGVIIYEIKDGCRSTSQNFLWRETSTISSSRRKFIVESRLSKKRYTFITERSKIAKYLCNLCSAQHKFNNEMNSRQLTQSLVSEENMSPYPAVCHTQSRCLKTFSCSETPQDDSGLTTPRDDTLTKLCNDVTARIETRIKQQRQNLSEHSTWSSSPHSSTSIRSPALSQRSGSEAPSGSPAARDTPTKLGTSSEREVLCVSLRKDPKLGLGIVIVGEDAVGHFDLGIFVASIVPNGPADRDGRIRAGGRLISLNNISLEGVTFSEAAEVIHNSSEEVQLIISQPKVLLSPMSLHSSSFRNCESQTTLMTDRRSADDSLDDIVSVPMTPKNCNRLHIPRKVFGAQDGSSLSPPLNCVRPREITLELRKISGSLGLSITACVGSGRIYIRSLVPGGAAERDGRLHAGDRLLEVDGISFRGFSYHQAVDCLSKTGEVVILVVERDSLKLPRVSVNADTISSITNHSGSSTSSPQMVNSCLSTRSPKTTSRDVPKEYSFVTKENTQEVTLTKSSSGLGFSFLMCELVPPMRDFGTLVRIKKLFPGQPAQQSGRIQEGDVLLAINGHSLKKLTYPAVLKLFKTSPPEVCLTLCRPAPGVLPSIEQLIGT
ncbi:hypothetical protein fugu_001184 [Takifugu bimaculatus]|uniref:Uncharacterized protein n=1 Tax=Takifugu bimaculatus TaxID=433685 RepID=A0A4Z2CIY7_9TELE|nr:hypothetical protein fugu_001184 [Takifugu bimaculatus]